MDHDDAHNPQDIEREFGEITAILRSGMAEVPAPRRSSLQQEALERLILGGEQVSDSEEQAGETATVVEFAVESGVESGVDGPNTRP